ncbi:MAG TPA: zinc-binding dehydrogenase [Anaerolineae bacterium]|nr:zinc-binding dehydrogenase [Anaerolineae bacterium]
MRAIVMHQRGGPEVLTFEPAFPDPAVGPDDVLIRVRACGLNRVDMFTRAGEQGVRPPLPHILGMEVAGDVAAVGENVRDVQLGERVLVPPSTPCGACEWCRRGAPNLCSNQQVLGRTRHGGYAEYVAVPARGILPLPVSLSYQEAASIVAAFGTAWHMLVTRARVQPGETVLVLAAGSVVGTAAIQVAKYFGCRVIATASSDEKLAKAQALGADAVINYARERFDRRARRLTDGRGVDVVIEHVGTDTWQHSVAALAPLGRIVTCGSTTGRWGNTDLWSLFGKEISLLGSFGATREEVLALMPLVVDGTFKTVIDRTFPLEQAADAHRYMAQRQQFGKLVLMV